MGTEEGDLSSAGQIAHASHWRTLSGRTEGKISTRSEMERTYSPSQDETNAAVPLFTFAQPSEKDGTTQPHPVRMFYPLISGNASNAA